MAGDGHQKRIPRSEDMRHIAQGFVERVTVGRRLPLDFSVKSLRVVDFLVDEMRGGAVEEGLIARNLFGLGAYVGEVLVRNAGAEWVDLDEGERGYFRQWVGVRMGDGMLRSPLGKVGNRFEGGGEEESLERYYLTLPGRVRVAA
ncbi:hypothetical protein [Streptomyces finlayi]|uniref:hypothetical protein n=1 Tax=Streptomyces finlayi TaxID=67296 RepID=UPI0027E4219A|nr:hypothetical protein [Streptomyces finlayi]